MTALSGLGLGTADPGLFESGIREPQLAAPGSQPELEEAFSNFVGQTFFGQLLAAMRKTVDKPAYFHGGRAEEVFQGQLDQMLAEEMSDASSEQFSGPMFELFMMQRPS